jgi:hypothetical protein
MDRAQAVESLRAVANRFAGAWTDRKAAALERCAALRFDDPRDLLAFHDCLLFLLAYPENAALRARAERELAKVAGTARRIAETGNPRKRARLHGSGIAWSDVSFAFGYEVATWLARDFGAHAELEDQDEGAQSVQSVLRLCLPPIEFEVLDNAGASAGERLEAAKGSASGSMLRWLLAQLERLSCSEETREHLFESLRFFIRISPADTALSRTFARGLPAPVFFHRGELLRHVDARALIDEPLPSPRRLSPRERKHLLATARGVLAMQGRETQPIAFARADGVRYVDLDRGLAIALFSMRPARRCALDTQLGMMVFKNGLPIAYGGGWPFLGTCKIGINVFAPFRGGESAYIFCQVLRVYRALFSPDRFFVERYQFGGDRNREGLDSGAFWFYYRLGFRPVETTAAELAQAEFTRIATERGYRTPLPIMRRLVRTDLELRLAAAGQGVEPWPNPGDLSLAVTGWIAREFSGDRGAAEAAAFRRVANTLGVDSVDGWREAEQRSFRNLSLLVALMPDTDRWSPRERRECVRLMRAKGAADEARFFELLRRHDRFREALLRIAAAGPS